MDEIPEFRKLPQRAATVMLVRDCRAGLEVYLTRRSAVSRFVPNTYVFPGGAVDLGDADAGLRERLVGAPSHPELRIAAIRELFEEAGVLLACEAGGGPALIERGWLSAARAAVQGGRPFNEVLLETPLRLDARGLVHYSNWITPQSEPVRFDAHFFIALAPAGQEPVADGVEVHDGAWFAPRAALAQGEQGRLPMIFPTIRHLERLAQYDSVAELLTHARSRTIEPVRPVQRAGGELLLPGGEDRW